MKKSSSSSTGGMRRRAQKKTHEAELPRGAQNIEHGDARRAPLHGHRLRRASARPPLGQHLRVLHRLPRFSAVAHGAARPRRPRRRGRRQPQIAAGPHDGEHRRPRRRRRAAVHGLSERAGPRALRRAALPGGRRRRARRRRRERAAGADAAPKTVQAALEGGAARRDDELEVLAMCGGDAAALDSGAWPDPRLPLLGGARCARAAAAAAAWRRRRAARPRRPTRPAAGRAARRAERRGGAAGAEALPLESNLELPSGGFAKGCYLGQDHGAHPLPRRAQARCRPSPPPPSAAAAAARRRRAPPRSRTCRRRRRGGGAAAARRLRAARRRRRRGAGAPEAGAALHDGGGGKAVGKLRAFEPRWGVGLALCRISVLEGGGAPLEPEGGGPTLYPLRPSWWPPEL